MGQLQCLRGTDHFVGQARKRGVLGAQDIRKRLSTDEASVFVSETPGYQKRAYWCEKSRTLYFGIISLDSGEVVTVMDYRPEIHRDMNLISVWPYLKSARALSRKWRKNRPCRELPVYVEYLVRSAFGVVTVHRPPRGPRAPRPRTRGVWTTPRGMLTDEVKTQVGSKIIALVGENKNPVAIRVKIGFRGEWDYYPIEAGRIGWVRET